MMAKDLGSSRTLAKKTRIGKHAWCFWYTASSAGAERRLCIENSAPSRKLVQNLDQKCMIQVNVEFY